MRFVEQIVACGEDLHRLRHPKGQAGVGLDIAADVAFREIVDSSNSQIELKPVGKVDLRPGDDLVGRVRSQRGPVGEVDRRS